MRIVVLVCSGFLASACSGRQPAPECAAGEVAVDGACAHLCTSDSDCTDASLACRDSVCSSCVGCRSIPEVDSVEATGSPDGPPHARSHLRGSLVLSGRNLEGVTVTLTGGGFSDERLVVCGVSTADRVEVAVPSDVVANQPYTLAIANAAGSCAADVTLLQGEQGEKGEPGVIPPGTIMMSAAPVPPSGWLLCDGAEVSRATYAALFAAIGTAFGPGDGASTFNLPDLRGRLPLGKDDMGGIAANRVTDPRAAILGGAAGVESHIHDGPAHAHTTAGHTLSAAESGLPDHSHPLVSSAASGGTFAREWGSGPFQDQGDGGVTKGVSGGPQSAAQPHDHGLTGSAGDAVTTVASNVGPFLSVNFLIKE